LCLAEETEGTNRALANPLRNGGPLHQPQQFTEVTSMRLLRNDELDLGTTDAGPLDVPHRHRHAVQLQPAGEFLEPGSGYAEREEGAQGHISADSRRGIQNRD